MKRKAAFIVISFILLMSLTACLDDLGFDDFSDETISQIKSNAEVYLQEKYNMQYHVDNCEVVGNLDERQYFIKIDELDDSFDVFYDKNKMMYYDDKQSEEIIKAIKEEIWQPMLDSFPLYYEEANEEPQFNRFHYWHEYQREYSCFNCYYDGDIKKFANNEMMFVWLDKLVIVDDDVNSWVKHYQFFNEYISKYFRAQENGRFIASIVTSDYYEYQISHEKSPAAACEYDEGCIAEMWFSDKSNITVNKYIQLNDNIYVMLVNSDGYILVDGDIKLVTVENADELKKEISEGDKSRFGLFKRFVSPPERKYDSPIYRLEFSDRLKKIIGNDRIALAFMVKDEGKSPSYVKDSEEDNEEEIESYLFKYDRLSSSKRATLLCVRNGYPEYASFSDKSQFYIWLGTGPLNIPRAL